MEYTNWNPELPGFNDDVLRELAVTYEEEQRVSFHAHSGHLTYDAMSHKEEVVIDRHTLSIKGLQDVGNLVTYTDRLFEKKDPDPRKAVKLSKQCLQLVFISMDGLHKVRGNREVNFGQLQPWANLISFSLAGTHRILSRRKRKCHAYC